MTTRYDLLLEKHASQCLDVNIVNIKKAYIAFCLELQGDKRETVDKIYVSDAEHPTYADYKELSYKHDVDPDCLIADYDGVYYEKKRMETKKEYEVRQLNYINRHFTKWLHKFRLLKGWEKTNSPEHTHVRFNLWKFLDSHKWKKHYFEGQEYYCSETPMQKEVFNACLEKYLRLEYGLEQ